MFALHHVQLACPAGAEDELRAYYGGVLGMTETPRPPVLAARGGVWFQSPAGAELHLGVEPDFRPARKAHPGLLVAELSMLVELAARLQESGHQVNWDANRRGYRASTPPTRSATGWEVLANA